MKKLGLFLVLVLVVAFIPSVIAEKTSQRDRLEEKANKLEKKIDVLMVLCKQVDFAGAWAYCFSKGYDIYKDRLYKYVDPSYQLVLENKMYSWSQKLKSS